MYGLALYITIISCIIPFNIIEIVYNIIFLYVKRSTRRVWIINANVYPNTNKISHPMHRTKREIKIMKQMIVQTSTLLPGGPIFLFLIMWHATQKIPAPEPLYLLAFNLMTIAVFLVTIVQFMMSKKVKHTVVEYIIGHRFIHH